MFETLSLAMRGNQNARKKVKTTILGGAVGAGAGAALAKAVASGAKANAKAFRKQSLNTVVPKILATEALNKAIKNSNRAVKLANKSTAGAMAKQASEMMNVTTNKLKVATKKLYEAHAIKPVAIKNAKQSLAMAKLIGRNSKTITAAGAIAGATLIKKES
jgi:hypothetical protein